MPLFFSFCHLDLYPKADGDESLSGIYSSRFNSYLHSGTGYVLPPASAFLLVYLIFLW